jgi:cytochrome c5
MSASSTGTDHKESHGYGYKLSKQGLLTLVFCLVIPAVVIISLVSNMRADKRPVASPADAAQALAERIQKVGMVEVGESVRTLKSGEDVFKARCAACHASGAAGAPKFGDSGAWGPRIKSGFETLLNSALKGKNGMAPQSGGDLSDFEIARGVVYMVNNSGGKFDEPKAPADEKTEAKK